MEKLNITLYRHLFLEFSSHINTNEGWQFLNEKRDLILEKYGIINNIDEYINIANRYFKTILNENDKTQVITLTNNIFSEIKDCLFEKVEIIIDFKHSNEIAKGNAVTFFNEKDCFRTKLNIIGNNISFSRIFNSLFAHELLHFYENKMRVKNNKKNIISALSDDGYFKNSEWNSDNLNIGENRIKKIKYYLTKPEINAYLSGLREELIAKITPNTNTVDEIFKLLKTTSSYLNIKQCGIFINEILNEKNEETKKEMIKTWNDISNKKIDKYNDLKRILKTVYNKRYRNFISKASRIAYEVYNDYCCNITLPSSTNFI